MARRSVALVPPARGKRPTDASSAGAHHQQPAPARFPVRL